MNQRIRNSGAASADFEIASKMENTTEEASKMENTEESANENQNPKPIGLTTFVPIEIEEIEIDRHLHRGEKEDEVSLITETSEIKVLNSTLKKEVPKADPNILHPPSLHRDTTEPVSNLTCMLADRKSCLTYESGISEMTDHVIHSAKDTFPKPPKHELSCKTKQQLSCPPSRRRQPSPQRMTDQPCPPKRDISPAPPKRKSRQTKKPGKATQRLSKVAGNVEVRKKKRKSSSTREGSRNIVNSNQKVLISSTKRNSSKEKSVTKRGVAQRPPPEDSSNPGNSDVTTMIKVAKAEVSDGNCAQCDEIKDSSVLLQLAPSAPGELKQSHKATALSSLSKTEEGLPNNRMPSISTGSGESTANSSEASLLELNQRRDVNIGKEHEISSIVAPSLVKQHQSLRPPQSSHSRLWHLPQTIWTSTRPEHNPNHQEPRVLQAYKAPAENGADNGSVATRNTLRSLLSARWTLVQQSWGPESEIRPLKVQVEPDAEEQTKRSLKRGIIICLVVLCIILSGVVTLLGVLLAKKYTSSTSTPVSRSWTASPTSAYSMSPTRALPEKPPRNNVSPRSGNGW